MEEKLIESDPDSRIRNLEARNRRLERMGLLAVALLIVMGLALAQQRWSGTGETGKPVALLLGEDRKPQAVVQVDPSGQVRLVSLRPDGSLPELDARGLSQHGTVTLHDSAGNPRLVFGSGAGELTTASMASAKNPAQPSPMSEHCNLTNPAGGHAHETHLAAAQSPKKEEGEAASVREELGPDGARIKTVLFKDLPIEGIYPSMTGPRKMHRLVLGSPSDKQVWVTAFQAQVLDSKNNKANKQFMCHTALDVVGRAGTDNEQYRGQAFTVSQGQTEITLPTGFAVTIPNESALQQDLLVQVLNNNDPQMREKVNFETKIHYFGEQDAMQRKLIPLRLTGGSVNPFIDGTPVQPHESVARPAFKEEIFTAADGRQRTGHWLVPPGRQVLASELPLDLAKDTTVHYILMHVHPYAKSVELRDTTAKQSVWKGLVQNDPDPKRAAVLSTDTYSSSNGLKLRRDHKYELVATYENPTPRYVDAMASLWMYVRSDLE